MSAAAEVAAYFRTHGCDVWITGTDRKARATKGLPDLFVLHPLLGGCICFEVKKGNDRPREAQIERKREWETNTLQLWVFGYLPEACALLLAAGIIPTKEAA